MTELGIRFEKQTDYSNNTELIVQYQQEENKYKKQLLLEELIKKNFGLVAKFVYKYKQRATPGFDQDDMAQLGVLGLIKSFNKFDASKGFQFSTYAYYWVHQSISRGMLENSSTIKIAIKVHGQINQMRTLYAKYITDNEELDVDRICKELKIDKEEYDYLDNLNKNYCHMASLEIPINESGNMLKELISEEHDESPERKLLDKEHDEQVEELLKHCKERERKFISQYYGLKNKTPKNFREIGEENNISRQAVQQIINRGIERIRQHYSKGAECYFDS